MIRRKIHHLPLHRRNEALRLERKLHHCYKQMMAWRKKNNKYHVSFRKQDKHRRWTKWMRQMHRLQDRYDKLVGFVGCQLPKDCFANFKLPSVTFDDTFVPSKPPRLTEDIIDTLKYAMILKTPVSHHPVLRFV